ncbi:biotin/lipoate--protein ligase family protein [Aurantimonas sp. A2-1-M11]|uniref:biotin/lipoate--protein ligase family protein n=1 Tax=Aurantimonas sp. A2-1-M11 TaxID=3113712 RepID=UPI002F9588C5
MSSPSIARLDLPPPYSLVSLREAGNAMAHAQSLAARSGAGTLVWARRFHVAEFALVLEPEEPLQAARRVIHAAGNAIVLALAVHAPAQHGVTIDWPDTVRVDGALVGGLELSWPSDTAEDDVPHWLVLGCTIRTVVMRAGEPGLRRLLGGLDEQGFDELDPATVVEGFARYFLREMDTWQEQGFAGVRARWLAHAPDTADTALLDNGDTLRDGERRSLATALTAPSWRDPATGEPWL